MLEGKPTAAISASPSPRGGAWALADLRKVLTVIGAGLTETELAIPEVHTQLTPGGHIADPALRGRITALISDLAQHATAASPDPGRLAQELVTRRGPSSPPQVAKPMAAHVTKNLWVTQG